MKLEVLADADAVAAKAALVIAAEARQAIAARGRFLLAVSGGRTPWVMLRKLADEDLPWHALHVFQVDERVAPDGHADRNLTHLRENLLAFCALPIKHLHAMPVDVQDLEAGVRRYAAALEKFGGIPAVLDLVHLGLGPDGHTASLVPGDRALDVADTDVAMTGLYQERRRMTLTYPILNRARRLLWLVTGAEKAPMLVRLLRGDPSIPGGRVSGDHALVLADKEAAAQTDEA